eukprot:Plantae.Rhodophyta-Palmaria_palmata.ctg192.p3 GENE.Plantae.Rhodophyta-Palmaria_palmata.ctg192~~Plantae.Rhodophyta-Palmaria_palmata.ctg192.p3  ORF type:complete len:172 (+),score=38.05 Plantae.Rhodophyta-Palmaria_palmata.ctg192:2302-2817(+)
MRMLHDEMFKKSAAAKSMAEKFYNKTVEERSYEPGDRVLIFDFKNSVKKDRKLRVTWLGPYKAVEHVTAIIYILEDESNGLIARSHVNRLARLSERLVEPEEGIGGIFPDTRRGIKSILGWKETQNEKQFKIVSRGRNGHKWVKESDLPPLVLKAYLGIMEDRDSKDDGTD